MCGATGFIGQALGPALPQANLLGVGRRARPGDAAYPRYVACDLFSRDATAAALRGAEVIVYLVHSMMPAARLTQGRFEDLDLACADNVARAAAATGARQIIYLGGLRPRGVTSAHLASRDEVGRALGAHGVPVTTLRAGLVMGPGGSSMEILARLVGRLPVMITPRWTATRTQPVALRDVVDAIAYVVDRPTALGRDFDLAAPEVVTYRELMRLTGERMGRTIRMLPVPLLTPGLSRLWLTLVTGAPRELAAPLVESLAHEMLARERTLETAMGRPMQSVRAALDAALASTDSSSPAAFRGARGHAPGRKVYSVQRMQLPAGRDAAWAGAAYLRWLHGLPLLRVTARPDGSTSLRIAGIRRPLLVLAPDPTRSTPDHTVMAIAGGALAKAAVGTFEVRQVLGDGNCLTVVDGFEPRLPWWLYRLTQAPLHALVMALFRRHLRRQ